MSETRIRPAWAWLAIVGSGVLAGAALIVALSRLGPSELAALSDALLKVGLVGLVFLAGVVTGGLWLAQTTAHDDPGRAGPDDPTPPDPTLLQPDDLDRELERLLSGHRKPGLRSRGTEGQPSMPDQPGVSVVPGYENAEHCPASVSRAVPAPASRSPISGPVSGRPKW